MRARIVAVFAFSQRSGSVSVLRTILARVNIIYGILRKKMSTPPPDPHFFVTFRMIFLLTKQKGKFDLLPRATNTHLRGTFRPTSLPQRLVQSTQKQHRFFYTCTTCTKHAILTECSLLRAHFSRNERGHALRVCLPPGGRYRTCSGEGERAPPLVILISHRRTLPHPLTREPPPGGSLLFALAL